MDIQKPKIRKYTVKKNIIVQENRCEVRCEVHYDAKDNFILGKWLRSGTSIRETPSNREILCKSCCDNFWAKLKETGDLVSRLSGLSGSSVSNDSNYQVKGWTIPLIRYEWELNSCQNNESCWGEKEQFVTFSRRKKSDSETQYRFMQYKIHQFENRDKSYTFVEKDVNSLYFNVHNVDRLREEGIGLITVTPTKPFFWPGIHKHLQTGDYYYYIEIFHNIPVHPAFKNGPWPTEYWRRKYMFPTMVDIIMYKATPGLPKPETHQELEMNHEAASKTCLNLYPGGAGLECRQWKYLKKDECKKVYKEKLQITEPGEIPRASWVYRADRDYTSEKGTFIPGFQDGWSGPVVTYFERINNANTWFK